MCSYTFQISYVIFIPNFCWNVVSWWNTLFLLLDVGFIFRPSCHLHLKSIYGIIIVICFWKFVFKRWWDKYELRLSKVTSIITLWIDHLKQGPLCFHAIRRSNEQVMKIKIENINYKTRIRLVRNHTFHHQYPEQASQMEIMSL